MQTYIYHFYNRTKDKKTKYKIRCNVKRLDKLYFIFLIISWVLFVTAGVGSVVGGGKSSLSFIGAILSIKYFTFLWIAIITRLDWFFLGFDVDGSPD